MKFISVLSLLLLNYKSVQAYSECSTCNIIAFEEGINWGVENNDWCSKYKI